MSFVDYISLPSKPKVPPLSDFENSEKKAGLYHGKGCYQNNYYEYYMYLFSDSSPTDNENLAFSEQIKVAMFKDCFKNPLVYGFSSGMIPGFRDQFDEIVHGGIFNEETRKIELEKLYDRLDYWQRQMLYETVDSILDIGEFIEILTVITNHVDFNYGPPTSERTISLEDVLTLKQIMHHPEYPNIKGGYKLTIIKTS